MRTYLYVCNSVTYHACTTVYVYRGAGAGLYDISIKSLNRGVHICFHLKLESPPRFIWSYMFVHTHARTFMELINPYAMHE